MKTRQSKVIQAVAGMKTFFAKKQCGGPAGRGPRLAGAARGIIAAVTPYASRRDDHSFKSKDNV